MTHTKKVRTPEERQVIKVKARSRKGRNARRTRQHIRRTIRRHGVLNAWLRFARKEGPSPRPSPPPRAISLVMLKGRVRKLPDWRTGRARILNHDLLARRFSVHMAASRARAARLRRFI